MGTQNRTYIGPQALALDLLGRSLDDGKDGPWCWGQRLRTRGLRASGNRLLCYASK